MTALFNQQLMLSHFRSHKLTSLDLDSGPIAITGANGAGKTNILEAVSLLSPGRGLRRAAAADMARQPDGVGWKIRANVVSGSQTHDIETSSQAGQPRTVRIDDKPAPQTALGRIARVVWLVPSMDRLWTEGPEGRRRFLDRITMSFEPSHADAILAYEKSMRERNRLLKDQQRDEHWYRALEIQMAESGDAIQRNRDIALTEIAAAQDNAQTAFPTAELSLVPPENEKDHLGNAALLSAFAASRPRDLAAGRTLVGPHRVDLSAVYSAKSVAARDCSTGEQKALLISLIMANARALAARLGMPPILLLDEVSAHLDEERRAALYEEICALRAQAWMTGTEVSLFDALGKRAQYFDVTDSNGISEVYAK